MFIILPECPRCGCSDIRCEMWLGYKCYKCGYVYPEEGTAEEDWE